MANRLVSGQDEISGIVLAAVQPKTPAGRRSLLFPGSAMGGMSSFSPVFIAVERFGSFLDPSFFRRCFLLSFFPYLAGPAMAGPSSSQVVIEQVPLTDAPEGSGARKIDAGAGGVLIPALTKGRAEPQWALYDNEGKRIGAAVTGRILPVSPGIYTAKVGSGSRSQQLAVKIEVRQGFISRVQPNWGALVVHLVNEEETPFRGFYQLFEFISRDAYGFGRGAEEELGETVDTWLLPPGIYKLVGPLETYEAIRNFVTIEVLPNRVIHYAIVADSKSGDFLGSGVVPTGDFTVRGSITGRRPRVQVGGFKIKARIGGDFSQSASDNVLGLGGNSLGFGLFTDFSANYLWKKHIFNLFIDLEGGVRKNSDENFVRKVRDEISISSIYIHQTWPLVGRYVRFQATTQFAKSFARYDDPTEIVVDGVSQGEQTSLQLSGSFDPLFLQEGMGLNFRLFKNVFADLDARVGGSLRHTISSGFLVRRDDSQGDVELFDRVRGSTEIGAELVLLGAARFGQIASYRNYTNAFVSTENKLRFRSDHIVSVRLVKSLSVGLLLGLRKDDTTADRIGFTQALFIRASKRVF